ncbi:MAG: hypothetical protein ACLGH8_01490 [Bacteroidia bacterium]
MDSIIEEEDFIKKGRMKKDFFTMSEKEKEVWLQEVAENTRRTLFEKGQPLVYRKDGVMVAEYCDGRIVEL